MKNFSHPLNLLPQLPLLDLPVGVFHTSLFKCLFCVWWEYSLFQPYLPPWFHSAFWSYPCLPTYSSFHLSTLSSITCIRNFLNTTVGFFLLVFFGLTSPLPLNIWLIFHWFPFLSGQWSSFSVLVCLLHVINSNSLALIFASPSISCTGRRECTHTL